MSYKLYARNLPLITDSWNASLTNFVSFSPPNSRSLFVLFSVNNSGGCFPSGPLSISNLNTSSSVRRMWGQSYMSQFTWKSVFGVSDQVRLKPACSATETSYSLEILDIETRSIILSQQRITKALIRLRRCTGWSEPLLFAYVINRFSHDMADIYIFQLGKDKWPKGIQTQDLFQYVQVCC